MRIEFACMPFDLVDDAAGFCPTPGLIGEVHIGAPHFVRRPPNRARQQMADPFLQDAVRRQPYCVFDPLGFEKLINFGLGETRVGPEINARDLPLVAFDNRLQHTVPSVGAVDVAGTKRTSFQVTELVEHEERMIAGAGIVAVPDAVLLFAVSRTDARIHVQHVPRGGPERSASAKRFLSGGSHCVSKRPIWLGDAAQLCDALPPTIQRIAGSWRRRSASFTSWYPARRLKTD